MKRAEAESIWGMVASFYDLHPERRGEQATVWVPALEEMDADIVMGLIQLWLRGEGPAKMPSLPAFASEVRTASIRKHHKTALVDTYECDLCEDNHVVTAGRYVYLDRTGTEREGSEQVAPCPACAGGKQREFPLDGEGVWGPDGFWRGRDWEQVGYQEVALKE